jgi:hypothetical protein
LNNKKRAVKDQSNITLAQMDALVSTVDKVTVRAVEPFTIPSSPPAWTPIGTDIGKATYSMAELISSRKSYFLSEGYISPTYNSTEGHWNYPATTLYTSNPYELFIELPSESFVLNRIPNDPNFAIIWEIKFDFKDGSWAYYNDYWMLFTLNFPIPYSPIYWADDDLPLGNSTYCNVNYKSLNFFQIADLDTPGENNLFLMWDPINPMFAMNKYPNDGNGSIPATITSTWQLRVLTSWIDKVTGQLPSSKIETRANEFFMFQMPAHMNHCVIPWNYIEFAKQRAGNQGGFTVVFQSRSGDGRLRVQSIDEKPNILKFDKNLPEWEIVPK